MADEEIATDGYEMFKRDRMLDIKGGCVLLYIRSSLKVRGIELVNNFPEQVWFKLKYNGNQELLIGVC